MANNRCTANLCIRKSRDFKSSIGYRIESSCPYKDNTCPHKRKPRKA